MAPKKRSKQEVKQNLIRASNVHTARGRLKGALQDIVGQSDEDVQSDNPSMAQRGRPAKRLKFVEKDYEVPTHQTYIMKLFDRSVDLARYYDNTTLYPICRAWMLNEPRSNKSQNYKFRKSVSPEIRKPTKDMVKDLQSGKLLSVDTMPPVKNSDIKRIPSFISKDNQNKTDINLDYDLDKPHISKEAIMSAYKTQWSSTKRKWNKHSMQYENEKYSESIRVLEAIYKL